MFETPDDLGEHAPARPAPPGSPRPRTSAPGSRAGAATPPPAAPSWASLEQPLEDDERTPGGRRRLLVAVAAVPWVVAAVALLRPGGEPHPAATAPPAVAPDSSTEAQDEASPPPVPGSPRDEATLPALGSPPTRHGALIAPAATEAEAAAVQLVYALVGDRGPRPAPPAGLEPLGIPGYLDHVVVEAVDHPAPGAVVVTVLALLLQGEDRWEQAAAVRLAVPLRFDETGARAAGAPWRLPAMPAGLEPLETVGEPVDDPVVLADAGAAVAAAGYGELDVRALARTSSWPWTVTVVAVAPGESTPAEHTLWLRPHLGGFVVAGSRPPRADATP